MRTAALRSAQVEDVATAISANRAAYRRRCGLKAFDWSEMSEASREQFREMAQAAIASMGQRAFGLRVGPPKLSGLDRVRKALAGFWKRNVSAEYKGNDPI